MVFYDESVRGKISLFQGAARKIEGAVAAAAVAVLGLATKMCQSSGQPVGMHVDRGGDLCIMHLQYQ